MPLRHVEISSTPKSKLKVSVLVKWKSVDQLKVLISTFNDKEATEILDVQIEHMNLMYKVLTGDDSPEANKGTP